MFSEIRIQNFKSIQDLTLKPGRVTVLIGENGSGKSNILEAIAFAAGASADKLDNEYLANRGIRISEPIWMKSAFSGEDVKNVGVIQSGIQIEAKFSSSEKVFHCNVNRIGDANLGESRWSISPILTKSELKQIGDLALISEKVKSVLQEVNLEQNKTGEVPDARANSEALRKLEEVDSLVDKMTEQIRLLKNIKVDRENAKLWGLTSFLIYAPDYSVLRNFRDEGAIQPIGARGEGLLKLLQTFSDENLKDELTDMKERLHLFGWFDDFIVPDANAMMRAQLQIKDKWLAPEHAIFDQRSANEGFLFVLFYFTLLMSKRTPKFFAIDNIDTALNPRLCAELMKQIVELAKKYDKQVICTTHNPAILDGLDLKDDEQRLFVVSRDFDGKTGVHRIRGPKSQHGESVTRLSVAFIRGSLGGLPTNF